MNILFLCTGNIGTSPMAEGILRAKLEKRKLNAVVDSAGFESYNINEPPDARAINILQNHGIDISGKRCKLFQTSYFDEFDHIFVMYTANIKEAEHFARNENDMKKLRYLLSVVHGRREPLPNPGYLDQEGFEMVYKRIDEACEIIADGIENNKPF